MNTAHITKQMHEMTHTPILRVIVTYTFDNKRHAHTVILNAEGRAVINRTVRWAAAKGVELTIRPI